VKRSWRVRETGEWKEEREFLPVVAWGPRLVRRAAMLWKGSRVLVEGRIRTDTWQDDNGAEHKQTQIVADDIILDPPTRSADPDAEPKNN